MNTHIVDNLLAILKFPLLRGLLCQARDKEVMVKCLLRMAALMILLLIGLSLPARAARPITDLSIEDLVGMKVPEASQKEQVRKKMLNVKVSSVAKSSQALSNAAAAVFVIDQEAIKRSDVVVIPVLLVSPWSGVISDVVPKRTILLATQATAMALAWVLAALAFSGVVQVGHILVLAALLGIVNAFDAPARQSFVVNLVGREDLVNGIALNSMMLNSGRVIGPAVSGFLLVWLGAAWCFLVNGISYIAVITSLLSMRMPAHVGLNRFEQPLKQFAEGLTVCPPPARILGLLLQASIFSIFGMAYAALLPAFVDQVLHADASAYGAINALVGVGAVLAALSVAYFTNIRRRGRLLVSANLAYPLLLAAFGFQYGSRSRCCWRLDWDTALCSRRT